VPISDKPEIGVAAPSFETPSLRSGPQERAEREFATPLDNKADVRCVLNPFEPFRAATRCA